MNKIPRRDFLRLSGVAATGAAAWPALKGVAKTVSKSSKRPNILVFLTDDHGQWAQHAYGNSELVTPNLDGLAQRGTRMRQAFTTCPVCSPARASFFTGRMPSQHGIHDWLYERWSNERKPGFTPPDLRGQTLISELLKAAGYHTGLVGKWHCGCSREPQPGFDRWFSYWVDQYPHTGVQRFSDQGRLVTEDGHQSPLLTRRAVEFIEEHQHQRGAGNNPFFLFISYVDTHSPHNGAPEQLVEQYQSASFRDIPQEQFARCHGRALQPVSRKPELEREKRMQYYGAVSSLDREVGKVMAALDAAGQTDNTLVVYTGDHGLNCGHHGFWEKGNGTIPQNFVEESLRVACTLSWPAGGVQPNATSELLVNHCDLWSTLLEAAEASPQAAEAARINSPGVSYLQHLRGNTVGSWRQVQVSEYGNARMARTQRYKLIRRYPYAGVRFPDELYDSKEDPRETTNRFADSSLGSIVQELSAELARFFGKYTVEGRSGLEMERQAACTPASPWLEAARDQKKGP